MADGTDRVSPFDPAVPATADGSSGLWWRESHIPVQRGTSHLIDFISGADESASTYPRDPLPASMTATATTAWLGLLRLGRADGRVLLRIAGGVPTDITESPPFLGPGPDFEAAVEASLRIVVRYREHAVTLAPPVAASDPYNWIPAGDGVRVLCRAVQADLDADTAQPADVALLRAEAALGVDVSDPAAPTLGVPGAEEIARSLSPTDVSLTALEIRHPDISDPVRVVNDATDHVIGGETYVALRFAAALRPSDEEGRAPRAEIEIDNIGQILTEWLERAQGGAGATVRAMSVLARTHEVEWEIATSIMSVEVGERIRARLGWDPLLQRPAVMLRHDRYTSPGIF